MRFTTEQVIEILEATSATKEEIEAFKKALDIRPLKLEDFGGFIGLQAIIRKN